MKRALAALLLTGLVLAQSESPPAPTDPVAQPVSLFDDRTDPLRLILYDLGDLAAVYSYEAPPTTPTGASWNFLFSRKDGKTATPIAPHLSTSQQVSPDTLPTTSPPHGLPLPEVRKPTSPSATPSYPFPLPTTTRRQPTPPSTADVVSENPVADPRLQPGALVPARLVTAAVVPAGLSVPVLVEASNEKCPLDPCPELRYLGEARIMIGGRVEVKLQYAVSRGRAVPINASGFAKDDIGYGLKGDVIEQAPSLAADLIRGTLGGISDWTNAALQAQDTTITSSGAVAVTKSTPPLSSFLASRAANLFALPQDSKALTRVLVVPAGTPLFVYVQQGTAQNTDERP